jgi:predicted transcriptional regulator
MVDPAEHSVSELPFLSPAEWQIYALLSKKGPLTVRQLVAELSATDAPIRSYTTVFTLAQRLASKGYLYQMPKAAEHGPGSAITFRPSFPYEEAFRRHAERFLAQYAFGDPADLHHLRQLIDLHLAER